MWSPHFRDFSENGPIGFSARVRRQLKSGPSNFFIYDTDSEDESGPWGAWEAGETKCYIVWILRIYLRTMD